MEQHKSITSLAALLLASVACGATAQTTPPTLKDVEKPKPAITQSPAITSPLDESQLKQVVEDPGKGQADRMRSDGVHGLDSGPKDPTRKGINDKLVNDKATITRGRHADTFGADRINNANQGSLDLGHGTRDPGMGYKGMHGDPASIKPGSDEAKAVKSGSVDPRPLGKNQWGGNTYAKSVDDATYLDPGYNDVGTLSYDSKGKLREDASYKYVGTTGLWWVGTIIRYPGGSRKQTNYPNPEADITAGGIVLTPGMSISTLMKRSKVAGGKAGGSGDGRDPNASTGGSTSEQAGKSIMMGKTGGNEAKQSEGGGTINMDKVLEINTLVNPVRH